MAAGGGVCCALHHSLFLLILVCYVDRTAKYLTYVLKSADVTQIIVGLMANFGKAFYHKRLFYFFSHVFYVFNVFFYFYLNVYYIYDYNTAQ